MNLLQTYPIQNLKQGVPITILRKNSHLRPRTNSIAAMLRIRSRMAWAAHNYFMVRSSLLNFSRLSEWIHDANFF